MLLSIVEVLRRLTSICESEKRWRSSYPLSVALVIAAFIASASAPNAEGMLHREADTSWGRSSKWAWKIQPIPHPRVVLSHAASTKQRTPCRDSDWAGGLGPLGTSSRTFDLDNWASCQVMASLTTLVIVSSSEKCRASKISWFREVHRAQQIQANRSTPFSPVGWRFLKCSASSKNAKRVGAWPKGLMWIDAKSQTHWTKLQERSTWSTLSSCPHRLQFTSAEIPLFESWSPTGIAPDIDFQRKFWIIGRALRCHTFLCQLN